MVTEADNDALAGAGELLRRRIRVFPDFPQPGVAFQDLADVYTAPALLATLGAQLAAAFDGQFDSVVAVEARGFVVGTAVALAAGCPLVLARKPGKLPGPVDTIEYALEYGSTALQLQREVLSPDDRVIVVDDVLATGGTLAAAAALAERAGATVVGFAVLLALAPLGGRERLRPRRVVAGATVGG